MSSAAGTQRSTSAVSAAGQTEMDGRVGFTYGNMLKRFVAAPVRRSHLLAAPLLSRLIFLVPEAGALLLFAAGHAGTILADGDESALGM